ncbi:MAG: ABC transporter ATP-binding protein [Chloroflexi bacterium]|nr:ABC transporter ATP-binding protein [Chloroflexota bacterium]
MIRCEGLVYAYPDGTRALDGLDLAIERGERVAITGRNGSGKSTLVRHWNGLLRPGTGRVLLDGLPTADRPVAELARVVALTFQDPDRQLFARTCRREVAFGARNVGLRGAELARAVDEALGSVGLAERGDANPFDLGGSKRRLLALASALVMRTPVVVLDEPTMGLDAGEIELVAAVVGRLAADGRTVVAISHDARFVAGSFGRVVRLDAGKVVADERTGP